MMEKNKFKGHKPLIHYVTHKYWSKGDLKYYEFEKPKGEDFLYDLYRGKKVDKKIPPYVFGINLIPEKFIDYDFLDLPDGPAFVVHDRVLKILEEMCPDDFQRFDAIIKNLNPEDPPFENKEFHMINVTHRIKALDLEKSVYEIDEDHMFWLDKRVYKEEDCWEGHLLAREDLESTILFHPKLAHKFRYSKGIQFLTDKEAPC